MKTTWMVAAALVATIGPSFVAAAELDSALETWISNASPQDTAICMFVLVAQYDLSQLDLEGMGRHAKQDAIASALIEYASTTQQSIQSAMNVPGAGQTIRSPGSLWLVNAVYATVNPAAAQALAARSDVSSATLSEILGPATELRSAGGDCGANPQCSENCPNNLDCHDCPNEPCDPPCWHCTTTYNIPQPACNGYTDAGTSWAISWIDADDVWSLGYKGDGVSIGYIDVGFDYYHPDLAPNHLRNIQDPEGDIWATPCPPGMDPNDDDCNGKPDDFKGWDFGSDEAVENNDPYERKQGFFPGCRPPGPSTGGTAGHGTGTLSVAIGAGIGNSVATLRTGIAPHAWYVPIKAGNPKYIRTETCCQGSSNTPGEPRFIDALQYAQLRHVNLVIAQAAEGQDPQLPPNPPSFGFRQAADALLIAELLLVAPAGDIPGAGYATNPGNVPSPWVHPLYASVNPDARPSGVLSVGSILRCTWTHDDEASGEGPVFWEQPEHDYDDYPHPYGLIKPDVSAPTVNLAAAAVNECWRLQGSGEGWPEDPIYKSIGGTSGAAPVVAGTALLMLSKDNELKPAEIDSILETTASAYSPSSKSNELGSGVINALSAVNKCELFNHFDGMFNANPADPSDLIERTAEDTHWKSHPDAGTPAGQWRFINSGAALPAPIDGVLEGEAPLSKRSLTTVHHDRQSYRMDVDFEVKDYPAGGGHLNPLFGVALRYDQAGDYGLYLFSRKAAGNNPTQVVLVRKQAGDPLGGIYLAQANLTWDWTIDTPFSWHVWDDGSTVTLTADRPGVPGIMILDHFAYGQCNISTANKGVLVEDGTKVQFDNVRIEGFQPVTTSFPNLVISRYMMVNPGSVESVGGCPANNDPIMHPGGLSGQGHAGDYWIEAYIRDTTGRPIKGLWDVMVDFSACAPSQHFGMPSSGKVYADAPTDAVGRTIFRSALAFGGSHPCGFSFKAGGQVIKSFPGLANNPAGGLRNIDQNGDGFVALGDLSEWQQAFVAGGVPKYKCDLDLDVDCDLGDLSIFQLHFVDHEVGGGDRNPPKTKTVDEEVTEGARLGAEEQTGTKTDAREEREELFLTLMDRLPSGAPMPPVSPQNAVTTVGNVGPGGRDITVGLYAASFTDLAGAHIRCRWPEGWELTAVGDSLVSGQIFGTADRYWTGDRSYMTAFDCVSGGPVAIGRFDLHVTRAGTLRFDQENALVRVVDCRGQQRDLVSPGAHGLEEGKNLSDASALVPTVQIIRRSPTVSDRGAEFNLILGKEVSVSATVYDVTGRVVKVVADQVVMPAGDHRITWDGTTNRGGRAGSGVYIVKLRAEKEQLTENIVLLR